MSKDDKNFQRPFDPKRVEEIKAYVLGKDKLYKKGRDVFAKGFIPNAIVLNLPPLTRLRSKGARSTSTFPTRQISQNTQRQ